MASINDSIRAAQFLTFCTFLLRLYFSKRVQPSKSITKTRWGSSSPFADKQRSEVIFSKSLIELMKNHERDHRSPNSSSSGFSLNQTAAEESVDEGLRVGEEM